MAFRHVSGAQSALALLFDAVAAPCLLLSSEDSLAGAWGTLRLLLVAICGLQNMSFPLRPAASKFFSDSSIRAVSQIVSIWALPPDWSAAISAPLFLHVAIALVGLSVVFWGFLSVWMGVLGRAVNKPTATAFRAVVYVILGAGYTPLLGALLAPLDCRTPDAEWSTSGFTCTSRAHTALMATGAALAIVMTGLTLLSQLTAVDRRFAGMLKATRRGAPAAAAAVGLRAVGGAGGAFASGSGGGTMAAMMGLMPATGNAATGAAMAGGVGTGSSRVPLRAKQQQLALASTSWVASSSGRVTTAVFLIRGVLTALYTFQSRMTPWTTGGVTAAAGAVVTGMFVVYNPFYVSALNAFGAATGALMLWSSICVCCAEIVPADHMALLWWFVSPLVAVCAAAATHMARTAFGSFAARTGGIHPALLWLGGPSAMMVELHARSALMLSSPMYNIVEGSTAATASGATAPGAAPATAMALQSSASAAGGSRRGRDKGGGSRGGHGGGGGSGGHDGASVAYSSAGPDLADVLVEISAADRAVSSLPMVEVDPLDTATRVYDAAFSAAAAGQTADAALHMFYANFVRATSQNEMLEVAHLERVLMHDPAWDVAFAARARLESLRGNMRVICRPEQWANGEVRSLLVASQSLASKRLEFESLYEAAITKSYLARTRLADLWASLSSTAPDESELDACCAAVDVALSEADEEFQAALQVLPSCVPACREYASFLSEVMNDEAQAAHILSNADAAEDTRTRRLHRRSATAFAFMARDPLVDVSADHLFVATMTMNGTVTSVNAAGARMMGVSRDLIIGQDFVSLFPQPLDRMIQQLMDRLVSQNDSYIIGPRAVLVQHRSGRVFPVTMMLQPLNNDLVCVLQPRAESETGFFVCCADEDLLDTSHLGHATMSHARFTLTAVCNQSARLLGCGLDDIRQGAIQLNDFIDDISHHAMSAALLAMKGQPNALAFQRAAAPHHADAKRSGPRSVSFEGMRGGRSVDDRDDAHSQSTFPFGVGTAASRTHSTFEAAELRRYTFTATVNLPGEVADGLLPEADGGPRTTRVRVSLQYCSPAIGSMDSHCWVASWRTEVDGDDAARAASSSSSMRFSRALNMQHPQQQHAQSQPQADHAAATSDAEDSSADEDSPSHRPKLRAGVFKPLAAHGSAFFFPADGRAHGASDADEEVAAALNLPTPEVAARPLGTAVQVAAGSEPREPTTGSGRKKMDDGTAAALVTSPQSHRQRGSGEERTSEAGSGSYGSSSSNHSAVSLLRDYVRNGRSAEDATFGKLKAALLTIFLLLVVSVAINVAVTWVKIDQAAQALDTVRSTLAVAVLAQALGAASQTAALSSGGFRELPPVDVWSTSVHPVIASAFNVSDTSNLVLEDYHALWANAPQTLRAAASANVSAAWIAACASAVQATARAIFTDSPDQLSASITYIPLGSTEPKAAAMMDAINQVVDASNGIAQKHAAQVYGSPYQAAADPALTFVLRTVFQTVLPSMRATAEAAVNDSVDTCDTVQELQPVFFLSLALVCDVLLLAFIVPKASRVASAKDAIISIFLRVRRSVADKLQHAAITGAERVGRELVAGNANDEDDTDEEDEAVEAVEETSDDDAAPLVAAGAAPAAQPAAATAGAAVAKAAGAAAATDKPPALKPGTAAAGAADGAAAATTVMQSRMWYMRLMLLFAAPQLVFLLFSFSNYVWISNIVSNEIVGFPRDVQSAWSRGMLMNGLVQSSQAATLLTQFNVMPTVGPAFSRMSESLQTARDALAATNSHLAYSSSSGSTSAVSKQQQTHLLLEDGCDGYNMDWHSLTAASAAAAAGVESVPDALVAAGVYPNTAHLKEYYESCRTFDGGSMHNGMSYGFVALHQRILEMFTRRAVAPLAGISQCLPPAFFSTLCTNIFYNAGSSNTSACAALNFTSAGAAPAPATCMQALANVTVLMDLPQTYGAIFLQHQAMFSEQLLSSHAYDRFASVTFTFLGVTIAFALLGITAYAAFYQQAVMAVNRHLIHLRACLLLLPRPLVEKDPAMMRALQDVVQDALRGSWLWGETNASARATTGVTGARGFARISRLVADASRLKSPQTRVKWAEHPSRTPTHRSGRSTGTNSSYTLMSVSTASKSHPVSPAGGIFRQ